jgi:hypothetical protein
MKAILLPQGKMLIPIRLPNSPEYSGEMEEIDDNDERYLIWTSNCDVASDEQVEEWQRSRNKG